MVATSNKFLHWIDSETADQWGYDPNDFDPEALRSTLKVLGLFYGHENTYFRTEVVGFENLPDTPSIVVGNHSGGTSFPDVYGFATEWYRHFGVGRPIHGLAHEMVFALEPVGRRFAKLGVLRASRDMAETLLNNYHRDMMVYPGGDLDTWRPWKDRFKVRFSGRKGYAKLAIRTQTAVVPVAHAGAHDGLIVLTDGRKIAKALHFPELFRANIFPLHLSFPYGLGIGPVPHIPPPSKFRYRIGPAVMPPTLAPGEEPTDAMIDDMDRRVREALQRELDVLKAERTGLRSHLRDTAGQLRGRIRSLVRS